MHLLQEKFTLGRHLRVGGVVHDFFGAQLMGRACAPTLKSEGDVKSGFGSQINYLPRPTASANN